MSTWFDVVAMGHSLVPPTPLRGLPRTDSCMSADPSCRSCWCSCLSSLVPLLCGRWFGAACPGRWFTVPRNGKKKKINMPSFWLFWCLVAARGQSTLDKRSACVCL